uniref:Uncharacterized protein n=1 Tax=Panagrolaimus sp. JU765 TaxID=591449 RepID=A0AC34RRC5_9BILA
MICFAGPLDLGNLARFVVEINSNNNVQDLAIYIDLTAKEFLTLVQDISVMRKDVCQRYNLRAVDQRRFRRVFVDLEDLETEFWQLCIIEGLGRIEKY